MNFESGPHPPIDYERLRFQDPQGYPRSLNRTESDARAFPSEGVLLPPIQANMYPMAATPREYPYPGGLEPPVPTDNMYTYPPLIETPVASEAIAPNPAPPLDPNNIVYPSIAAMFPPPARFSAPAADPPLQPIPEDVTKKTPEPSSTTPRITIRLLDIPSGSSFGAVPADRRIPIEGSKTAPPTPKALDRIIATFVKLVDNSDMPLTPAYSPHERSSSEPAQKTPKIAIVRSDTPPPTPPPAYTPQESTIAVDVDEVIQTAPVLVLEDIPAPTATAPTTPTELTGPDTGVSVGEGAQAVEVEPTSQAGSTKPEGSTTSDHQESPAEGGMIYEDVESAQSDTETATQESSQVKTTERVLTPTQSIPLVHPLSQTWTLSFADTADKGKSPLTSGKPSPSPSAEEFSHGIIRIFTASTVEDLLGSWKAFRRRIAEVKGRDIEDIGEPIVRGTGGLGIQAMGDDKNFHFFVNGIVPMWEDPMCGKGGKIMFTGRDPSVSGCI